ncbi:hypothetical protein [Leptolyngbya iicbica]|uniref:Uncharacterized protein n=2 Tax=Cyanophyceae TaxID=3028117 RepID=A0A4Q7DZS4_9CYAN|nr:hypothetical protein [Leptolyngbya sp. LK]RZM74433.1 hypothetical protein DYY88_23515 [Leptolyngbya sp. LK]
MQTGFSLSTIGFAGLLVGSLGLAGCPSLHRLAESPSSSAQALPVVQSGPTQVAIATAPPTAIAYDICGEIDDWQRPSLEEQTTALQENPRYGEALATEPLQSLFEKFWHESLITFTTYGLSARTEPIYLSGVWTGIDEMSACYEGDRPTAINAGERAEMWLIGYQVVDFTWTGDQYQMTVEPTTTGLRFLQFERVESAATLPLVVLENTGATLTVATGDW